MSNQNQLPKEEVKAGQLADQAINKLPEAFEYCVLKELFQEYREWFSKQRQEIFARNLHEEKDFDKAMTAIRKFEKNEEAQYIEKLLPRFQSLENMLNEKKREFFKHYLTEELKKGDK